MTKKIIIVGGGFAGLNLAKKLSNNLCFEVTVVDRNNYHFFPPLLYQVSTAFVEASNISYPFRKLFQDQKNIRFYMGDLLRVIPETNMIETNNGSLSYDYLILAMGTETNFFGNENIMGNALPMKTIDDALNIRNHILLRLEEAIRSTCLSDKKKLANIVIAGGGPTGVEMAGMIAEMGRYIAARDYPEDSEKVSNIYLVHGSATLLNPMSRNAQKEAYDVLTKLGVKTVLNTLVTDYVNDEVILSTGEKISAATLIWTSGVVARRVNGIPAEGVTRAGRIIVDEINRVKGFSNIFAIGDQCFQTTDKNYTNGHPQLAQVAIQQGRLLAKNLNRLEEKKLAKPFAYNNKGSMAIIAKYRAVVDLPKGYLDGFFAWCIWLFIHVIPLVGFGNRIKLAFNWLGSFITKDQALRLIIRPDKNKV